ELRLQASDDARVNFFFSSRRQHTRSLRDWSSDVCSSDLNYKEARLTKQKPQPVFTCFRESSASDFGLGLDFAASRGPPTAAACTAFAGSGREPHSDYDVPRFWFHCQGADPRQRNRQNRWFAYRPGRPVQAG